MGQDVGMRDEHCISVVRDECDGEPISFIDRLICSTRSAWRDVMEMR